MSHGYGISPAPANGVQMKIWQCYAGIAAQTWTYTSDHRLQLSTGSAWLSLELAGA